VSETVLEGGDVNVVVRVGDTVRRPLGEHSPAVHALLRHFEAVGFDGAPRFLGIDTAGREILSFVGGEAALAPLPTHDDVLVELGRLLRRVHEAVADFDPPAEAKWFSGGEGPLICHRDLFPPNVILRDGKPVALIDWDLAGPAEPLDDVVSAASHWAPLRTDWATWGLPADRQAERVRILCDAYGLSAPDRARFVDVAVRIRRGGYELHRRLGGEERRPGWREMWDAGSGEAILGNLRLLEELRPELEAALA
jgi:aminoglycoside phosphotransferase (APT) family kinase protein